MTKSQQRAIFLEAIAEICRLHNASVTSWIRTEKRNRSVGGHPHSQHLSGTAVDVVPDDQLAKLPIIQAARKLTFVAIDEGDHIHIQVYKAKP